MEWSGWGRGWGLPGKKGCRKALGPGEQTQPPKHWFVESEITSDRAGGQGLQGWSGRTREGSGSSSLSPSLSSSSTGKSAPCTKHTSVQGRWRGPLEATSAAGAGPGVPFTGALWVRPGCGGPPVGRQSLSRSHWPGCSGSPRGSWLGRWAPSSVTPHFRLTRPRACCLSGP